MKIRALIADDEALARENLRTTLAEVAADLEVAAEASDGRETVALALEHKPDAIFLDIHMPVMDGFKTVEALMFAADTEDLCLPEIVFTTAYDQYALQAIQVNAVHYLVKPVTARQLALALERVRHRLLARAALAARPNVAEGYTLQPNETELQRLVDYLRQTAHEEGRTSKLTALASRVHGKIVVFQLDEITHISADGGLNFIHTDSGKYVTDYMLDELEQRLDPARFMRIHRSHLVNVKKVKALVPWGRSQFKVLLDDKTHTELPLSRYRVGEMRARFLW